MPISWVTNWPVCFCPYIACFQPLRDSVYLLSISPDMEGLKTGTNLYWLKILTLFQTFMLFTYSKIRWRLFMILEILNKPRLILYHHFVTRVRILWILPIPWYNHRLDTLIITGFITFIYWLVLFGRANIFQYTTWITSVTTTFIL